MMQICNLFADAALPPTGERFDTLLDHGNLVIERILSSANVVPTQYVQAQDEWVMLLRGEAVLEVAGRRIELKSGDYLYLPSRTPHTVASVSEGALWLAIHLHATRTDAPDAEDCAAHDSDNLFKPLI